MQLNEPRYAGRLPSLTAVLRCPPASGWHGAGSSGAGSETRCGSDAWQFDELVAELSGAHGRAWREFTRGTLYGLTFGRSELGDGPRIGFVSASRSGLRIARLRVDAELRAFWRALAAAAFGLVGEEYPPFSGNPEDIAARYVVGMTASAGM